MIGLLFHILWRFLLRILVAVFYWLLGILISTAFRLGAILFRFSIAATGWLLALLDLQLGGRISRRATTTILSSGGLWALVGLIAPFLFGLFFREGTLVFSLQVTAVGFVYGLACGYRVRQISGWGTWATDDGLRIGESWRLFHRRAGLSLSSSRRSTSLWAIGQPGTGKSRAIVSWVMNDIKSGRGAGVFDPHQDLYRHIAQATAVLAGQDEELARRVVLVDPLDERWAVGFNPLQLFEGATPERIATYFRDITFKIWGLQDSDAPRMSSLMLHTFAALAELGLTLVELPVFLRDHEWRNKVMARIESQEVRDYFLKEFPTNERLRQEWTQSTLNKMVPFVMDPDIRLILGQRRSTIHFRELMDHQGVLLVNLPKGELGTEQSQLFGAFLLGMIQQAALSRADMPDNERKPFYLYLDEFQNYTTNHIQEILSESRKYGLSLTLAHQYLEQLPPELRQAVMNTYGTLVCFRVGYQDAVQLTREVFTPDLPPARRTRWTWQRMGQVPVLTPRREYGSLDAEWERLIRELTTLQPRQFWALQKGRIALKQRSLDAPNPNCPPLLLESLTTVSGIRHARRKEDIRRELSIERPRLLAELAGGTPPDEGILRESLPPKWST